MALDYDEFMAEVSATRSYGELIRRHDAGAAAAVGDAAHRSTVYLDELRRGWPSKRSSR